MTKIARASLVLGSLLSLGACVTAQSPESARPEPVSVMTWNVENLFDTVHDEGKNDWTFLPLDQKDEKIKQACKETSIKEHYYKECINKDWNETFLKEKLQRLATVILSQNKGKGADLVLLCEVENIRILERLRQDHLEAAGYGPGILLEGPDDRGIDCAFLTRLALDGNPALHPITLSPVKDSDKVVETHTRAILQADFKLPGGDRMTALAIHFPAGFHPIEHRKAALNQLKAVAQEAAKKSQVVIAAGDFNINFKEADELYNNVAAKDWHISHLVGCKDCQGTYYFDPDKNWSFFDAIMVFKGGLPPTQHSWKMDPESIKVVNENFIQKKRNGHPLRFFYDKGGEPRGISDHFPVWMQLKPELQ